MQVDSISVTDYSTSRIARGNQEVFDKNAFLQLLVAQLKHQDPLNPQGSQDFISQLVQFATVEQLYNLVSKVDYLVESARFNEATALVGKAVMVEAEDGAYVSGTVEKVSFLNGKASVYVDGKVYDLVQVVEVR